MVPYAGHDPSDRPFGGTAPVSRNGKRSAAGKMFKAGRDTVQIASALDVDEYLAERWITRERCERLGLPDPYEVRP